MIPKLLVLPGSAQSGSPNLKLAAEAARMLALTEAEVTLLNLGDFPLPIFEPDAGPDLAVPENAIRLAERMSEQDGLLIVSAEHNGAVPPLLLNSLAWIAAIRRIRGRPVQPFRRLVVGLASASSEPSALIRHAPAMRAALLALGAQVLTETCALGEAVQGFDEFGRIRDEEARNALEVLTLALLEHAKALGRHG